MPPFWGYDRVQHYCNTQEGIVAGLYFEEFEVGQRFEHLVRRTVTEIRTRSSVLAGLEKDGKIAIVGSMYHLEGGRVEFFS